VKLERAERLLTGLSGEQTRWAESRDLLSRQRASVVGDVLVACGFVAYLGPFTHEFRRDLAAGWVERLRALGIPVFATERQPFSLERVLGLRRAL